MLVGALRAFVDCAASEVLAIVVPSQLGKRARANVVFFESVLSDSNISGRTYLILYQQREISLAVVDTSMPTHIERYRYLPQTCKFLDDCHSADIQQPPLVAGNSVDCIPISGTKCSVPGGCQYLGNICFWQTSYEIELLVFLLNLDILNYWLPAEEAAQLVDVRPHLEQHFEQSPVFVSLLGLGNHMQADPLLKLRYDDRRLDGARVDVSPAIYLVGDVNGVKMKRSISKAVVWVKDNL
ncbi:hypothetical protein MBM_02856 [Drepanopeziza brunnea f. sp. 'multigermtubi' MB_m1]|uniref:Uncharacterized protein n=1 Tax=Marssonina brunnea f. sp. multigermtubi (strain MB_m1) TaxID=1072389 RepID=K1Y0H5_MARBU|nr:uncharacterized protein MBM_02856 [Drepanopeziza brunnea f. sp. 'multigermtubi' MB_m1]EKD18614.1 hypothetical protein MBM_02856 [Drepanopeziza brunnea f. sp. 'multigermtubi' MB_m1]